MRKEAEGTVFVQPAEEKAKGKYSCSLQVPKENGAGEKAVQRR